MGRQADRLRRMHAGGWGNVTSQRYARVWSVLVGRLPLGQRWVVLEVTGRTSGRATRLPLWMADVDGQWYLGFDARRVQWVRNGRAADGPARHGLRHDRGGPPVFRVTDVTDAQ